MIRKRIHDVGGLLSVFRDLINIIIPPILAGPAAAVAMIWVTRRREQAFLRLFWVLLPVLNLISAYWMAVTMGEFIGPGGLACMLTPFAALVGALILVLSRRRVLIDVEDEPRWRRAYRLGTLLIPILQLSMIVVLGILAPRLCELGLRTCSDR
jgi:hypothetical protein